MKFKVVETNVCEGIEHHNKEVCKVVNTEGLGGLHITLIINQGRFISTVYYTKTFG